MSDAAGWWFVRRVRGEDDRGRVEAGRGVSGAVGWWFVRRVGVRMIGEGGKPAGCVRCGGLVVCPAGRGEDDWERVEARGGVSDAAGWWFVRRVGVRMIGEGEKPAGGVRCGGSWVRSAGRGRMIGGICKRGISGVDAGPLGIQKNIVALGATIFFKERQVSSGISAFGL